MHLKDERRTMKDVRSERPMCCFTDVGRTLLPCTGHTHAFNVAMNNTLGVQIMEAEGRILELDGIN